MTQYVSINFNTYIKEADLIKAAITKNTLPENINPVKTLNDFVKDILKDNKKQNDLDFDNVFENIQDWNWSVMGPLSETWTAFQWFLLYPGGFSGGWLKRNSGIFVTNSGVDGTRIEFYVLLKVILHAVDANKLTTAKKTNAEGRLKDSTEKW